MGNSNSKEKDQSMKFRTSRNLRFATINMREIKSPYFINGNINDKFRDSPSERFFKFFNQFQKLSFLRDSNQQENKYLASFANRFVTRRYSPFFLKEAGVKQGNQLMTEQQFENQWNNYLDLTPIKKQLQEIDWDTLNDNFSVQFNPKIILKNIHNTQQLNKQAKKTRKKLENLIKALDQYESYCQNVIKLIREILNTKNQHKRKEKLKEIKPFLNKGDNQQVQISEVKELEDEFDRQFPDLMEFLDFNKNQMSRAIPILSKLELAEKNFMEKIKEKFPDLSKQQIQQIAKDFLNYDLQCYRLILMYVYETQQDINIIAGNNLATQYRAFQAAIFKQFQIYNDEQKFLFAMQLQKLNLDVIFIQHASNKTIKILKKFTNKYRFAYNRLDESNKSKSLICIQTGLAQKLDILKSQRTYPLNQHNEICINRCITDLETRLKKFFDKHPREWKQIAKRIFKQKKFETFQQSNFRILQNKKEQLQLVKESSVFQFFTQQQISSIIKKSNFKVNQKLDVLQFYGPLVLVSSIFNIPLNSPKQGQDIQQKLKKQLEPIKERINSILERQKKLEQVLFFAGLSFEIFEENTSQIFPTIFKQVFKKFHISQVRYQNISYNCQIPVLKRVLKENGSYRYYLEKKRTSSLRDFIISNKQLMETKICNIRGREMSNIIQQQILPNGNHPFFHFFVQTESKLRFTRQQKVQSFLSDFMEFQENY